MTVLDPEAPPSPSARNVTRIASDQLATRAAVTA
jgi:hypothetical protein